MKILSMFSSFLFILYYENIEKNKYEQRTWEWKYSLYFFFVCIDLKQRVEYINNVPILGIDKERK